VADADDDVATALIIRHWRQRLAGLPEYLRATFAVELSGFMPSALRLVRMRDGSIRPENIGREAAAVWIVEGGEARAVPFGHEWERTWDTEPSDVFYLRPSYLFYRDGCEVLLSERYGPSVAHRSLGRISQVGGVWEVEWATCWHTDPEQRHAEPDAAADGGV